MNFSSIKKPLRMKLVMDHPEIQMKIFLFNYHSAKLAFGFMLFEFSDAIKEGDGHRLFNLYKLALLIYKCNGHFKYAYIVLLYLVKCIAILSKFQAFRLKWN